MPGEGESRVELCAHHHVWKIDRYDILSGARLLDYSINTLTVNFGVSGCV
jgi:hypothetical protein